MADKAATKAASKAPSTKAAKAVPSGYTPEQSIWYDQFGVRFNHTNLRFRVCGTTTAPVITQMKGACPRITAPEAGLKAAAITALKKLSADAAKNVAELAVKLTEAEAKRAPKS